VADFSVTVTNGAAFTAALEAVARQLPDLRGPLSDAGAQALTAARGGAPRRTWAMADAHSGSYTGRNRYTLTVAHPGAAPVHWGWPGHNIRRQPWVVATWNRDQHWSDRLVAGVQGLLDKEASKVR
jgi:hypothetical protein